VVQMVDVVSVSKNRRPPLPVQGDRAAPQGRERHHEEEVPGGKFERPRCVYLSSPSASAHITLLPASHSPPRNKETHSPPRNQHRFIPPTTLEIPKGLAKDLDEQRETLAAQQQQQKDLYTTIKGEGRLCVCVGGWVVGLLEGVMQACSRWPLPVQLPHRPP
jgi:hypothetical protein